MGDLSVFVLPLGMFALVYFFMLRPQQKRIKEAQEMLSQIKRGDHVVTIGGLHGVVDEVNDTTVVIDCDGVYLTFEKRAIGRVVPQANAGVTVADLQPSKASDGEDVLEQADADVDTEV